MRAWWLDPERNIALGTSAKAGSTSLRKAVTGSNALGCAADSERIYFDAIPAGYRKIGFIRHPVDRFYSLYRNIQERKRSPRNFYAQFEGKTPWDTFDGIVQAGLDYDIHFHPQHWIGLNEVDQLIRLDDVPEWWYNEFGEEFPHRNASAKTSGREDERVAARVRRRYQTDLELWERAGGTGQT